MSFARYKTLLRLFLTSFFTDLKNILSGKRRGTDEKKKAGSIVGTIFVLISLLFTAVSFIVGVYYITAVAVRGGYYKEVLYVLTGMEQLCILFFGGSISVTYLYFSADTTLLLSLPVTGKEIFSAKFTYCYLTQLFTSLLFTPLFIVYGVSAQISGLSIGAGYYMEILLTVLFSPALPMLLIVFISTPLMFFATRFKKKELVKNIVSLLSSLSGIVIYLLFFALFQEEDPSTLLQSMGYMKKFFIVEYHLCEGMLGTQTVLNGFLYVLESLFFVVLSYFSCAVFYRKIQQSFLETSSTSGKKTKKQNYSSTNIKKALFLKDLRLIFTNPTLLVSSILVIVLLPILIGFTGDAFSEIDEELSGYAGQLCSIAFTTYIAFLMAGASTSVAGVSISLEKDTIAFLKSSPVTGKDVVLSKMKTGMVLNALTGLGVVIGYLVKMTEPLQIVFGILLGVETFFVGSGILCVELKADLKKPNFRFVTVNELTKNNKKMLKPVLLLMAGGFAVIIIGAVLAIVFSQKIWIGYLIFYLICGILSIVTFLVPFRSLRKSADYLYERMEI